MSQDRRQPLDLFFRSRSIAVIGASANTEKVGYQILRNLVQTNQELAAHQQRTLFAVNPTATSILKTPCTPTISAITEPVECAIIVTPVGTVEGIVDEIILRNTQFAPSARTQAIMIISAGFAETDVEGGKIQARMVEKVRAADIRLIGPNTLGFVHTGYHINASFAQRGIRQGHVAVISQSGALLTSLFHTFESLCAGISFAVSLGNGADITEVECLEYALADQHTSAVVMYMESFSHVPKFMQVVSAVRKHKPVILLKGGSSSRGQAAAASHTAALATNQALLQAASEQVGFTMVENMEQLLNVAVYLGQHKHLPENTMVITNAGGPAVNTVDAAMARGVRLARWSPHALRDLAELIPTIRPANPLDVLGDASADRIKIALQIAQRDQEVDSILLIITPQAVTDIPAITQLLVDLKGKKPLFVSLMGGDHLNQYRTRLREEGIHCTQFANDAVDVLAILTNAAQHKALTGQFVASAIHADGHTSKQTPIHSPTMKEALHLLRTAGFPLPKYWIIDPTNIDTLETLSYPLFAKTANLQLLHKKSVGAVYGRVDSVEQAREAYAQLCAHGEEVLFQTLLPIQHEILVGIEKDPQFGPYLTMGLGGGYSNLLADRAYCFLPTTKAALQKAWRRTKAAQLLGPNSQLSQSVIQELERMQQLIMQHPWIKMVEINPLAVADEKLWVADIKLQV